jgi:hypothetical protein
LEDEVDYYDESPDDRDLGDVELFVHHPAPDKGVDAADEPEDAVQDPFLLKELDEDEDETDEVDDDPFGDAQKW